MSCHLTSRTAGHASTQTRYYWNEFSTRIIPGFKKSSYEERLRKLDLWTLEQRRNCADLLQVFKMYKGLPTVPFSNFFTLSAVGITRGHTAKIAKSRCQLDIRRFFFSSRVTDHWNRLQQSVIDSGSAGVKVGRH